MSSIIDYLCWLAVDSLRILNFQRLTNALSPPFIGVPWEYPKGGVHAATHSASKHALAWALLAPEFDLIVLTPWF